MEAAALKAKGFRLHRVCRCCYAVQVLTRVHLSRVGEPDAPVAAITEATKARGSPTFLGLLASAGKSPYRHCRSLKNLRRKRTRTSVRWCQLCPATPKVAFLPARIQDYRRMHAEILFVLGAASKAKCAVGLAPQPKSR